MIIGLSGYAGSGKDTAAVLIQHRGGDWQVKKFARKLKQIAAILINVDELNFEKQPFKESYLPEYGMTVREFLQKIGTDVLRDNFAQDIWVLALFADYKYGDNWLITDVRFPNEAQAIKDRGGVVVRINRGTPVNRHASETALDGWAFDYVVGNDGTLDDLEKNIKLLLLWHSKNQRCTRYPSTLKRRLSSIWLRILTRIKGWW